MEDTTGPNWLEIARAWRRSDDGRRRSHGHVEARLRAFAGTRTALMPDQAGISLSTVRRSAAALDLAERLAASEACHLVSAPEHMAHVGLAAMATLSRVARYGLDEVADLLPRVLDGTLKGEELLRTERAVLTRLGHPILAASTGAPAEAHLQRLSARSFRLTATKAIAAKMVGDGGAVAFLSGIGTFLEAAHVLVRSGTDGSYYAARVVPALATPQDRGRANASVLLAVALARVVERFALIAQDRTEADGIAAQVADVGPCGVEVAILPTSGGLEILHQVPRRGRPDLADSHRSELERLLKGSRRR